MTTETEEQVTFSINMPKSLADSMMEDIKREKSQTGLSLFKGQYICRAVGEWLKKAAE